VDFAEVNGCAEVGSDDSFLQTSAGTLSPRPDSSPDIRSSWEQELGVASFRTAHGSGIGGQQLDDAGEAGTFDVCSPCGKEVSCLSCYACTPGRRSAGPSGLLCRNSTARPVYGLQAPSERRRALTGSIEEWPPTTWRRSGVFSRSATLPCGVSFGGLSDTRSPCSCVSKGEIALLVSWTVAGAGDDDLPSVKRRSTRRFLTAVRCGAVPSGR